MSVESEIMKLNSTIDEFATKMKIRAAAKATNGYKGWDKEYVPSTEALLIDISKDFVTLIKGKNIYQNCIDIALRIMFIWYRQGGSK